jgi:hypothetical protein
MIQEQGYKRKEQAHQEAHMVQRFSTEGLGSQECTFWLWLRVPKTARETRLVKPDQALQFSRTRRGLLGFVSVY